MRDEPKRQDDSNARFCLPLLRLITHWTMLSGQQHLRIMYYPEIANLKQQEGTKCSEMATFPRYLCKARQIPIYNYLGTSHLAQRSNQRPRYRFQDGWPGHLWFIQRRMMIQIPAGKSEASIPRLKNYFRLPKLQFRIRF